MFVLPSRREGMPGSVIEAMALETPVVASDLPQVREVAGDCALLVPVGDVDGFARAMLDCLHERDATAQRAERAFTTFQDRFTIAEAACRMVSFYERAITRSR